MADAWMPLWAILGLFGGTALALRFLEKPDAPMFFARKLVAGLAWFIWIAGLLSTATIAVLWLVFGLAASAGAPIGPFIAWSCIPLAIVVGGSLWAMVKRIFVLGVPMVWIVPWAMSHVNELMRIL